VNLQVFSGVFADDPMFVCEVMQQAVGLVDQQSVRKTGKERQVTILNYCGRVLEVVTSRHRLIDAAWETEILSKVSNLTLNPVSLFLERFYIRTDGGRESKEQPDNPGSVYLHDEWLLSYKTVRWMCVYVLVVHLTDRVL